MFWWHRLIHEVFLIERDTSGVHSGIECGRVEHRAECSCGAAWRQIVINPLYSERRWMRVR